MRADIGAREPCRDHQKNHAQPFAQGHAQKNEHGHFQRVLKNQARRLRANQLLTRKSVPLQHRV